MQLKALWDDSDRSIKINFNASAFFPFPLFSQLTMIIEKGNYLFAIMFSIS